MMGIMDKGGPRPGLLPQAAHWWGEIEIFQCSVILALVGGVAQGTGGSPNRDLWFHNVSLFDYLTSMSP